MFNLNKLSYFIFGLESDYICINLQLRVFSKCFFSLFLWCFSILSRERLFYLPAADSNIRNSKLYFQVEEIKCKKLLEANERKKNFEQFNGKWLRYRALFNGIIWIASITVSGLGKKSNENRNYNEKLEEEKKAPPRTFGNQANARSFANSRTGNLLKQNEQNENSLKCSKYEIVYPMLEMIYIGLILGCKTWILLERVNSHQ